MATIRTTSFTEALYYAKPNDSDPDMFVRAEFSECRDYLIRALNKGCGIENPIHVYKIEGEIPVTDNGDLPWKPVVDNFDASYDLITNDGDDFYFHTTKDAPKYRIIKINVTSGEQTELIPESEHLLESVIPIGLGISRIKSIFSPYKVLFDRKIIRLIC